MADGDSRRKGRGAKAKADRSSAGSIYAFLRPRVCPAPAPAPDAGVEANGSAATPEAEAQESLEGKAPIDCEAHATSTGNESISPWYKRLRKRSLDASAPQEQDDPVRSSRKIQKKKSPIKTRKEELFDREHFDLRKEARRSTEEYALLSAGRPLHPFFQRSKAEQLSCDESALCSGSILDPAAPFHVLQETQNYAADLDWSNFDRIIPETEPASFSNDYRCVVSEDRSFEALSGSKFYSAPVADSLEIIADFLKERCGDEALFEMDRLKDIYSRYQASHNSSALNCLWTDVFQPHNSEQLCGNGEPVSVLSNWLCSWKQKILSGKLESESEQQELDPDSDDDYLENYNDDEELFDEAMLSNTLLVTGPVGCGKSAAVYACAKEQGFNVIEINASESRAGAIIKQKFGEAPESQALDWSRAEFGDDNRHLKKLTMILFEEVDTVFEEDKGFLTALVHFAKVAKRPIVLTSNKRRPTLPYMRKTVIDFTKPTMEEMVLHACMVFASIGIFGDPRILQRVVESCHQDLRKLTMQLQFWGQGALSSRKTIEEHRSASESNDRIEQGFLSRSAFWDKDDADYCSLPELLDLEFPCSQSRSIAAEVLESIQEADRIAISGAVQVAEAAALRQIELLRTARRSKRLAKKAEADLPDPAPESEYNTRAAASIRTCGRMKRLRKLNDVLDKSVPDVDDESAGKVSVEWDTKVSAGSDTKDSAEDSSAKEPADGLISVLETGLGVVDEEVLPSTSTSNEQLDPIGAKWIDLRKRRRSLLRLDSESVDTILKVNHALATAEEAFSSSDIMSASTESQCSEISQQLNRRAIHHLLRECDGALKLKNASNDASMHRSRPWEEQHYDKIQTQSHLQEQIFLANPKKARHGLTPASFVDHISYMSRIVAIEDGHQNSELSIAKLKRSRGYQDDYLTEKGIAPQGIQSLRDLFRFNKT